ncbi:helix-turn-helix domain-containing protein [Thalassomonas actiniarum]|uniref:Helix-turn-helix domain-containing protein n=1 Tax=Thalassomonas actiniarum TaxID=485447 RepID=A0AAE9YUV5_9GAMM|nr:helix-turn-helix domain-containing protein [Thalassomonas actiniarum]WDE01661.1 helix-turn-helix domain-containing protein [Thalassomonas actiniarum]
MSQSDSLAQAPDPDENSPIPDESVFTMDYQPENMTMARSYLSVPCELAYKFIWIEQGLGSHTIENIAYPLMKNRLYLVYPGQQHRWHENSCFSGAVCTFSADILTATYLNVIPKSELLSPHSPCPYLEIPEQELPALKHLIQAVQQEYQRPRPACIILRSLLTALLTALTRLSNRLHDKVNNANSKRVKQLKQLIEENYTRETSAEYYASVLGLTSRHLNEIAKANLSKTVSGLVHDRLILEAKRKLLFTGHSIKNIAYQLGFDDPAYFARFFRRNEGQSPNAYRDSKRQLEKMPHDIEDVHTL